MCHVSWRHSMVFLTSHVRHQSPSSWAKSDLQSLHLAAVGGTDKIQLVCLPSRLHSIKSVVETSGGILKEEASTCTASQGAWVTAHHSTSFHGCISHSCHRHCRDFLKPQEASAALLSWKTSLLSAAKQLSPHMMSLQDTLEGQTPKPALWCTCCNFSAVGPVCTAMFTELQCWREQRIHLRTKRLAGCWLTATLNSLSPEYQSQMGPGGSTSSWWHKLLGHRCLLALR